MTLVPGGLVDGRYVIVRRISHGGMGAVYHATDSRLADTPCAIKELIITEDDEWARSRFLAEMQVLTRLNHPGIPRVRDYIDKAPTLLIIMDFISGSDLAHVLENYMRQYKVPLPAPWVQRVGMDLLDILQYLHTQDPPVLHRDIKPSNILLDQNSGRVSLVDFGLALQGQSHHTVNVAATVQYAPREQISGWTEPRSDIYSLGATMFHLLSGQCPTPLDIPSLAEVAPHLHPDLVAVVDRACAESIGARFPDAAAMRAALAAVPEGSSSGVVVSVPTSTAANRATTDRPRPQIPLTLSRFMGRTEELEQLQDWLQDPDVRWISIVGLGGQGKSRLAAQAVWQLSDSFPDGVAWVDLSAVKAADEVTVTLGRALSLPSDTLGAALSGRDMLIVLDNCEQLHEAAVRALASLMLMAPRVRWLITSQAVLNIDGERVLPLSPLPCPDPEAPRYELEASPAVALFLDRCVGNVAAAADALPLAAQIVRRLEGHALAIELAAAQTLHMGLEDIARLLDDRLGLASRRADLPARQRTLRATLNWSYELLGTRERQAFIALGAFRGGFWLRAALAVLGSGDEAVETLLSLCDRSLVTHQILGHEARYRMPDYVSAYAAERLAAHPQHAAIARAHALHYQGLLENAIAHMRRPMEAWHLAAARTDLANCRQAWTWARSVDTPLAVSIAIPLSRVLRRLGYWPEAEAVAKAAVEMASSAQQAAAFQALAGIWLDYGRHREAIELLRRSLLAEGADHAVRGTTHNLLGVALQSQRDYAGAAQQYEAALRCRQGDPIGSAVVRHNIAYLEEALGHHDAALEGYQHVLQYRREIQDFRGQAETLSNLGSLLTTLGRREEALNALLEAATLFDYLSEPRGDAMCRYEAGRLLIDMDRASEARPHLEKAARRFTSLGATDWARQVEDLLSGGVGGRR